ncbi:PAS domain S-box protein [Rudanella paleaurantiibacter]|uniref:histidine kinase n=1 Tax=Rudanella paleaurantiibacter TaxID=2614655 RepID=A0A7J5TYM3_9BACT|nr:PAS domain S-box protein [Rudanella paleaurantiibacter]KAB7730249.1 PAS domain S-box protein [Rudanella paleaurantiibacter]
MSLTSAKPTYAFWQGGGQSGEAIRAYSWVNTALGPAERWAQSLRTAIGMVLHTPTPMALCWGPSLLCFHNDAFQQRLFPNRLAIGQQAETLLGSAWETVCPFIEQIMATGAPVEPDLRHSLFSFAPVFDETGVGGVLITLSDTTPTPHLADEAPSRETHFQQLTDSVPAIIWQTRPDGYCTYINRRWFDITGQTEPEALGFGWLDATHPDDAQQAGEVFIEANKEHKPFSALYRLRQKDGRYRWAVDSGTPQFGPNGEYRGMLGSVVDVHDQKLAEAEKNNLVALIEASHEFIGLASLDGTIQYLNPAGREMLGWESAEGNAILDSIHPDDRELALQKLAELETNGRFSQDIRCVNAQSGEPFWLGWNAFTIQNPFTEEISGVATVSANITARRAIEQQQGEMADLLRAVFDGAIAGISVLHCVRDSNGTIIDFEHRLANRLAAESFNRADLVGRRFSDVYPAYREAGLFADFVQVVETGQTIEQIRHFVGEQTERWYDTVTVKLDDGVVYSFRDSTAEMITRQKAHQSSEELAFAIEAAELGIWDLNPVTNSLRINSRLGDWFGVPADAPLNVMTLSDIIAETDRERVFESLNAAVQPGSSGKYETEYTITHRLTGQQRVVRAKGKAQFSPDGRAYRINGTLQDITEQQRADQIRRETEARFQTMAEGSEVLIAVADETGRATYFNKAWVDLTGRSMDDLLDYGWADLVHPEDREGYLNTYLSAFRKREPFSGEFRLRTKAGDFRWLLAKGPVRFRPDGSFAGYISSCVDITENKLAEQALRASEARLQSLIAAAPVAIGVFRGPDLVVELPNQAFIDIVGKGPDIVGKPLREVMPELVTENQPFLNILEGVRTTGKQFKSYDSLVKIVQNGQLTHNYYNITYTPLFDEAGEVYAILDIAVDVTGQVQIQQELTQQKAYLQNALEMAHMGTYRIDLASATGHFSENIRDWMNLETASNPMSLIYQKIHPGDWPRVEQVITDSLRSEADSHHDITYRLAEEADQPVRHLRSIGEVTFVDGVPVTINGIIQDVTPQLQARQAIEQSEQNLRSLVNSAPFPIGVYVGRDMRIQLANQSIIDAWGKGNDVIGKRYADVLPELQGQQIFEQLDQVFTTGISYHAQNSRLVLHNQGTPKVTYYNYNFTPLFDANGQVYGVMSTAADVTDLAVAKQRVEEAEASLRGAIELAELATWNMDVNWEAGTRHMTYSERLWAWFGFEGNETVHNTGYNPIAPADQERIEQAIARALRPDTGGAIDVEFTVIHYKTGQQRQVRAVGKTYFDKTGRPVRMTGTAQDVTEQRQTQMALEQQVEERTQQLKALIQDLERSNQNLQQFAYVASHDLQEPLRKIQSFGDLLQTYHGKALGEGVEHLNRMRTAAGRMSILINDLLTYSRISTRQDISGPVSLTEIVKTVLSDLDMVIEETGAEITLDPLPTVLGDRSQLGQLFMNLLSNALKFRQTDVDGHFLPPRITVTSQVVQTTDLPPGIKPARAADAYYRVDVSDNGIGFDQKYLDRIFQVFQRLHGKSTFAGTGIGLAICEKVAINHGGAITATSQPGEGATFTLYLPN